MLKGGGTDYTATSGTSVVLATGASVNDVIEIIVYDVFSVGNFFNRTDSDSCYVNVSGDTMTGSLDLNGTELILDADGDTSIEASTDDVIVFDTGGSERMRITDDSVLISTTDAPGTLASTSTSEGLGYDNKDFLVVSRGGSSGQACLLLNKLTNAGDIQQFRFEGSTVGSIGSLGGGIHFINATTGGIRYATSGTNTRVNACDETGNFDDDLHDIGQSSVRWDNIFATGGVTTTSDQNEKQDIANLTAKELKVANKLSALFKTYRWKDRVVEKGDKARTHSGIIAQDIQSAFSAEGLDASNYGMFCRHMVKR